MNQLAIELNEQLAGTVAERLLSDFGRRCYFPKGIVAQTAEATEKAGRYNVTVGMARTRDLPMMTESMEKLISPCLNDFICSFVQRTGLLLSLGRRLNSTQLLDNLMDINISQKWRK